MPAVSNAFAIGGRPDETRWSNFEEMMEHGNANPGELRYSSGSRNNLPHMVIAKVLQSYDVVAQNVPYMQDGNAVKDLKSGVLDFAFVNVGNYIQDKSAFNPRGGADNGPARSAGHSGSGTRRTFTISIGPWRSAASWGLARVFYLLGSRANARSGTSETSIQTAISAAR